MPQLLSLAIVSGKLVPTTPLPGEGFAERGLSVGGQGLANSRHFSNLAWGFQVSGSSNRRTTYSLQYGHSGLGFSICFSVVHAGPSLCA